MARISIMEALRRVLAASKQYTDDNSIILDNDELIFDGFESEAFPDLETEEKTIIAAINEINYIVSNKQDKEEINEQELIALLENILEVDKEK